MQYDNNQKQEIINVGERLRNARESMGLSQQAVADRLYLKISTIRGIEKNYVHPNVALIFFHGYIRSYAKLVHISEKEIMCMLSHQKTPIMSLKLMKHRIVSSEKIGLFKYRWLIRIIWSIFFIFIGLVFIYLWHIYQVNQQNNIINNHEQFFDYFKNNKE
ncbi:helix-turn-helix domain-containing protein [Blochmannia endosymbiont of Colobopsis nipponica]|uniref:helix-turn-helix domain-containing protein n=1 Tax=Blochmannia endosymbiont of Colobopsis nipponica TaxID=2681987 RepID=UPI0017857BE7|nr:helix-turn-helix domain-containing protein [Blochmannia endosymbiont of Colobopsis nipponica]QOI10939.1 helix-turn-helix domain-containing protein [Blochmannia endosymbiont of Colobopsis nipponica]